MNTDEVPLGQILDKLRGQGILKTNVEVMYPLHGKHGDICVVGGFTTTMVQEKAQNHDPNTYHMASLGENNHSMLQSS